MTGGREVTRGGALVAFLSCLAAGGWLGLADAGRASLEAPRPYTAADFARIVLAYAAAGGAWGAVAAFRPRATPGARLLPAHLLSLAVAATWVAGRILPRHLATPSLLLNAILGAAALALAAGLLVATHRRLARSPGGGRWSRPAPLLAAALLPLAAAGSAAALPPLASRGPPPPAVLREGGGRPPNLLVFLADTLRADRVGACGGAGGLTPRLDGFAAESAVFLQARATSSWTLPSITSLLTGLRPERHGVLTARETLGPGRETLFSIASAAGYRTSLISDSFWPMPEFGFGRGVDGLFLGPGNGGLRATLPWSAWGTARDWALDAGRTGTPSGYRGAPEIVRRALEWTDTCGGAPWCAYLHVLETHAPYAPASPSRQGRRRLATPDFLGTVPLDRGPDLAPGDLADLRDNYDDEVREVDAAFGILLDGLRERDLLDGTVVLFLSDHGEEFHEHGGWTHGHSLYEEVVRIPCILRLTGGTGRGAIVGDPVRIEDLLPTLLEACGIRADRTVDGRSVLPLLRGEADPPRPTTGYCRRFPEGSVLRSAVLDGWKLLVAGRGDRRVIQAFDLSRDPGERTPLPPTAVPCIAELRKLLEEASSIRASPEEGPAGDLAPETRRALEALGYLGRDSEGPK